MRALHCPHCTAPLPATHRALMVCPFCARVIADVPAFPWDPTPGPPWPGRPEDAGKPRLAVGDQTYVIDGRLARGDSCDVFLGHRDALLTERVLLKCLRAEEDADLLVAEQRVLHHLAQSPVTGAEYFRGLIPSVVRHGPSRIDGVPGPLTSVHRWKSGFVYTLDDVVEAYPEGVEPAAAIWMWKRALELLGWLHASGFVHGAVLGPHVLVHPRDHGVMLVGFTCAMWCLGRRRRSLLALRASARELYPRAVWEGGPADPATDLVMCARAIATVLGGEASSGRVPGRVPGPIAALVRRVASGERGSAEDAWALKEEVSAAAAEALGPPRYQRFTMPARERRGR